MKKHMGTQMGIGSLAFGIILVITDIVMFNFGKVFPVMIVIAPALVLAGIGFLILPGVDPPASVPEKQRAKAWWKGSPMLNKTVWVVEIITGLSIGVWLMISYTKFV